MLSSIYGRKHIKKAIMKWPKYEDRIFACHFYLKHYEKKWEEAQVKFEKASGRKEKIDAEYDMILASEYIDLVARIEHGLQRKQWFKEAIIVDIEKFR